MSRFPIRSSRRVVARRQPIRNMMLDGGGASGNGDRGALQHAAQRTSNPYYSNNFWYRWQEYTRWYMTSWEAVSYTHLDVYKRQEQSPPAEDEERHPAFSQRLDGQGAEQRQQVQPCCGVDVYKRQVWAIFSCVSMRRL